MAGLTETEGTSVLSDVMLMRIAQRVRKEQMYPLTANLLQSVDYLHTVEDDFAELRRVDHAFLIMVEWRTQLRIRRRDAAASEMVKMLKEADMDPHLVCQVCVTDNHSLRILGRHS